MTSGEASNDVGKDNAGNVFANFDGNSHLSNLGFSRLGSNGVIKRFRLVHYRGFRGTCILSLLPFIL